MQISLSPPGNTHMNARHSRPRRVRSAALVLALLVAAVVSSSGCNYLILIGYLIGGPPSIQPDFDKLTKESLTDKGVKVAVVCFAPDEVRLNFIDVDKDIAKYVARRLFQHEIKVVQPDRVQDWLDRHDDWDKPDEVAQATGATHVIFIDVHKYNLFEENSHELYRGQAELLVSVFKIQKDEQGEKIYTKEITSHYPLTAPRPTSEISYDRFRRQYLSRLSEEVGRLFYEYYNGDDMADVI
jgi:hypothetical protein